MKITYEQYKVLAHLADAAYEIYGPDSEEWNTLLSAMICLDYAVGFCYSDRYRQEQVE